MVVDYHGQGIIIGELLQQNVMESIESSSRHVVRLKEIKVYRKTDEKLI